MNFKGKDCVIHVPQCLAGMDERVDNSCKRRAEYLRRSLIIVCRELVSGRHPLYARSRRASQRLV